MSNKRTRCQEHSTYQAGCEVCLYYLREYRKRRHFAKGPVRVPAAPYRRIILTLAESGVSASAIGRAAGISGATVLRIKNGEYETVNPATARALRDLTANGIRDSLGYVPADEIMRMLRHLMVNGFSSERIAGSVGIDRESVLIIARGGRECVQRRVADGVRSFYEAHWGEDGGSVFAKAPARAKGWEPYLGEEAA